MGWPFFLQMKTAHDDEASDSDTLIRVKVEIGNQAVGFPRGPALLVTEPSLSNVLPFPSSPWTLYPQVTIVPSEHKARL